ncbi:hypothetical protein CC79DRAFT_1362002 [Sarocladium strictum]
MADDQSPESRRDYCYMLEQQNLLLKKRNHELEMSFLRKAVRDDELLPSMEPEPTPLQVLHARTPRETEPSPQSRVIDLEEDQDVNMSSGYFPPAPTLPDLLMYTPPPPPPRRVIRTKEDLSGAERLHVVYDMLKSRRRCCEVEGAISEEVTDEHCDKAIDLVLEGWNTSLPARRMEKLPKHIPDTHRTSRMLYGAFTADNTQVNHSDCRQEGADVYLYFSPYNIGGDAKRFSFRDSKGNPVREDQFSPYSWLDLDNTKEALMFQYDQEERAIITRLNERLMIAKAQRRLVQFADRGEANKTQPFFDPQLEKKHLDFVVASIYAI